MSLISGMTIFLLLLSALLPLAAPEVSAETSSQEQTQESAPMQPAQLQPVYADQVKDGEYDIEVESSSSMFRVVDAVLTVSGDEMSAVLTLGGTGYGMLFMGTGEEAAAAGESDYIPFVENAEGAYTYEVPVEALNQATDCAAWSIRKEQWYDRELLFRADSLPDGAVTVSADGDGSGEGDEDDGNSASGGSGAEWREDAVSVDVPDGVYQLTVTLEGGSGRTQIASPAEVTVEDGYARARIEWSSPNYDYMTVKEKRYEPVNEDGNSVFEIPVVSLDEAFEVIADTTAMSAPHEIEYTLCFDSSGFESDAESGVSAAAVIIILIAVLAALAAGIFAGRKIQSSRAGKKNR